jgi:hypothetical protein
MRTLRFGILGMSEGNGHPYSWSAIFNGYDRTAMAACPFPIIPEYLSRQSFPADTIVDAAVTHVWTQDRQISEHIAAAALIERVVTDPCHMIGEVDAILLARDDAERHEEFATPFLQAGLPIYIDKPLALSVASAERLYALQKMDGQIFTCSALAYAKEFAPDAGALAALGPLQRVEATTVKDWDRYAIHVIEPLYRLLANHHGVPQAGRVAGNMRRQLDLVWPSGLTGSVITLGTASGEISICLEAEMGSLRLIFQDTFAAFRAALLHFTDIVLGRRPSQERDDVLNIIRLVEAGRTNR